MAKNFQLIDIVNESQKISDNTINNLYMRMMESEKVLSNRKSLGIKEMFDDFDAGSDPGEEEDDFRNAASKGEFEDDVVIGGDSGPNISDEEARERYPDKYAAMVRAYDEEGMGDDEGFPDDELDPEASEMDDEEFPDMTGAEDELGHLGAPEEDLDDQEGMEDPDEFDPEASRMEAKKFGLIDMLQHQINEMKGEGSQKAITPRKNDFFVNENKVFARFQKEINGDYLVKVNENHSFVIGLSNLKPAAKSDDSNLRRLAKAVKSKHPTRNIWASV